jgi:hypothetical protein
VSLRRGAGAGGAEKPGVREAGTDEMGSEAAGAAEAGAKEAGTDETGVKEDGAEEAGTDEMDGEPAGTDEMDGAAAGAGEADTDEMGGEPAGVDVGASMPDVGSVTMRHWKAKSHQSATVRPPPVAERAVMDTRCYGNAASLRSGAPHAGTGALPNPRR